MGAQAGVGNKAEQRVAELDIVAGGGDLFFDDAGEGGDDTGLVDVVARQAGARPGGGQLALERIALGGGFVEGIFRDEVLLHQLALAGEHALLLGKQGFQSGNLGVVGSGLVAGVGRVDLRQQLALGHRFAGTHGDLDDPAGDLGADFRVVDRFQRAECALTDFECDGLGLGGGDQGRRRALLLGRLVATGRDEQRNREQQRAPPHAGNTCSPE